MIFLLKHKDFFEKNIDFLIEKNKKANEKNEFLLNSNKCFMDFEGFLMKINEFLLIFIDLY